MKKIRIKFETNGLARFISHLDLNRIMQYALRKSDIPVWYTEGFNSHLYVTFSNPLSLGFLNKCGIMEIKITDDNYDASLAAAVLDKCLPDSITAVESYESDRKFTEIAFSDYLIEFESDDGEAIEKAMRKSDLIATKKGKAGEYEINLAPHVKGLKGEHKDGYSTLFVRLPATVEFSINPGLLLDTAARDCNVEITRRIITRLELLDKEGKKFR